MNGAQVCQGLSFQAFQQQALRLVIDRGVGSADAVRGEGMRRETDAREQERQLIQRCLDGDQEAVEEFQRHLGPLIYSFPVHSYRMSADEAGDFYVFAFEAGRIFRRLRTFAGRVPLRNYLWGFVLDHLLLEWRRGLREIETVSIEALRAEQPQFEIAAEIPEMGDDSSWHRVLASLPTPKAVVIKLLHVEDAEFLPEEVRYLCAATGKRVPQVLREIEDLRRVVRDREAHAGELERQLEGVHAWIELYRKRLRRIEVDLQGQPNESARAKKLAEEREELLRKLAWREDQRDRLRAQLQRRKVTAPYKEIARILGTTVGNVASLVQRVRKEVAERLRPGAQVVRAKGGKQP